MARRRRSAGRGLLVLLLVLLVLVFAADRVAQLVAQNRVAASLQRQLGTTAPPEVDIQGFPFLTQVGRRTFPTVRVVADSVHPPGQAIELQHVDFLLRDVTASRDYASYTADRVTGQALLDYPGVQKLTGQPLRYAPPGRVQVAAPTTVMGLSVTATVVGRPAVDVARQTLSLADPQLSVAGLSVPDSTAKALVAGAVKPAPVKGLPYGLRLSDVTAQPDGMLAGLTGERVTFSG